MHRDPIYAFQRAEVPEGSGLYSAFKVYKNGVPHAAVMVTRSYDPDTFDDILGFSCYPEGLTLEDLIYAAQRIRVGIEDEFYLTPKKRKPVKEQALLQE